ncbi:GAF and ANTAR domain-containing protein [Sciscionella marina]|uniref:GAF and ANTAR domain-containing protein n=1 Tax=Sciscionella marina TaxID=508770 RepID=UPI00036865D6|nr:GAF and ANTAR domain-containing protein [Sciscionella marina]
MTDPSLRDTARETRLLQSFVHIADTLVDDYDVDDVLHELTEVCVDVLDTTAVGLMLADQRGGLQTLAASSEKARLLELFQIAANEGPCLECFRSGDPVLVDNIAEYTSRWPQFAPTALKRDFHSAHSIPLRLRGKTIGSLNLFGQRPGSPGEQDLKVARALADTATIGILHERTIHRNEALTEQLQTALNSRISIEQAKGVLAHASGLDMDQAFQRLRQYARRTNNPLSRVANQLTEGILRPDQILGPQASRRS